ncbi:hypothetical protein KY290_005180 [Solanum tuberosum]|uniref:Uncharacterized protein n=1 Tax=Solanum tuberosum TaxID=4113 RepID=A0ABQ7WF75_SOLTU|nr:hypothetical protein KY289_005574 [Solanum tuberosum]KAH0778753.1 hypothetical protein KY290_005180 [Solanum tuberosum]
MMVACCYWVSRAHGVEDVRGGFSMSMRRRRKGLFWGGEWWLLGGVSDVVHQSFWLEKEDGLREVDQWGQFGCFLVTFWLEKRASKGWPGSPKLASGCEVVYELFSAEVGWFQVGLVTGRKVGDGGCENGKNEVV